MLGRFVRKRWYRLLAIGPLVLFLSFLPSVVYLGHWTEFAGLAPASEEELMEHAGHCHITPAGCSEQPLPPDLSVTPALVRVVEPELTSVLLESESPSWKEHVVVPLTEPPRGRAMT